jgi:FkbM family methyltransferase
VPSVPADQRKISYAQNGEDVRVWRALRHLESPVYVEVGAHDPFEMSVTASLSSLGWHGILVEADPEMAQRLRAARPRDTVVAAAAYDRGGVLHLQRTPKPGQAFVRSQSPDDARDVPEEGLGTMSVPAVRLDDVLETAAYDQIHFMAIDVEGAEAAVLRGCDLRRWRPWILCVEATEPDSRTPTWQRWDPGVLAAGYQFVASDGLNRWYLADEHAELTDVVAEPFNILDEGLDGWRRVSLVTLERDSMAVQDRLQDRLGATAEQLREVEILLAQERAAATARTTERNEARESLALILASPSWRVTAPLRAVKRLAGGDRRGAAMALVGRADALLRSRPGLRKRLVNVLDRSPVVGRLARRALAGPPRPLGLHMVGEDDTVRRRRRAAVAALEQRARLRRSGS